LVELEPTDHPLAIDQRDGIDEERLKKMVVELLHQGGQPDAAPNSGSPTRTGDSEANGGSN
jgi:hypothetical protein